MKDHDAEGSKRVTKIVMKDTVITQIIQENFVPENECVGDSFHQEKDVLVKLVKLQTEAFYRSIATTKKCTLSAEEGD